MRTAAQDPGRSPDPSLPTYAHRHRIGADTVFEALEQGAAHAADGYARATGRVGVCLATSGPGATNLVTGIANAMLDSVPMVAITGNVVAAQISKDAFQEIDITGITMPITKQNYLVTSADDLPRVFAEAFHLARTGRPGPVHIDISKDALMHETSAPHPSAGEVAAEVPGAIAAARAAEGPALVHFRIAEAQNVFPFMPAGKGLSALIEE